MEWVSAASNKENLEEALNQCCGIIHDSLGMRDPDLVAVFVSFHHSAMYEVIPSKIAEQLHSKHIIGCSAGGVIGSGLEIENQPGISMIAGILPGVELQTFHLLQEQMPDMDAGPEQWESLVNNDPHDDPEFILLTDPFTIHSDELIRGLDYAFDRSTKIGGMASGGRAKGQNALFLDHTVFRRGAVGLGLKGDILINPVVAQGCRPVGKPLHVTKSFENIVFELDGYPTLDVLKGIYQALNERDQGLVGQSLFLGILMDEFQDSPVMGDFLIRNIVGLEPKAGGLAVAEIMREGQIVQFHLRDAQTSSDDLSVMLSQFRNRSATQYKGALLFSCMGRGSYLYGKPNHDVEVFRQIVGDIPLGGFFCNGEIGPVAGTTYLHGYTSAFGIFGSKYD
tara:strand:+ start:628 stop:1812 length:1185 start_codon:yes stop_codon:yes gene_type:complete